MIPKALWSFIQKLHSATENRELQWNEADEGAYFCDHKNHTLHITYYFDEDRQRASYFFRIVTNGKSTPFSVNDDEDDYATMNDLYMAVIANANHVENDLADFFE